MKPMSYIQILRPLQWLKNLMIFFPPFLGGHFLNPGILIAGLLPFIAFSLASSSTYILNDILDREQDREHPVKRNRPLPSGALTTRSALLLSSIFLAGSLALSYSISWRFLIYLATYLLITITYSFSLKNYPLLDIFCISSGFIIRLQAGGEAFQVTVSEWLFLSVFLLSIFLSTGKRYGERQSLGERAGLHRKALSSYPVGFLEGVLFMSGSAVLVTYTMYAVSRHKAVLLYSVPLCCFGLFRYILRIMSGKGGDPTESLTRDLPLFLVGLFWTFLVGWGVYGR